MKKSNYDVDKHGTSLALLRKAIDAQLVLLNEEQLRRLLGALNGIICGGGSFSPHSL